MSPHTHRASARNHQHLNPKNVDILRSVPYEKSFRFYVAIGDFTGEKAMSLDSFWTKLQEVPGESVKFHLQRGDFQKWIEGTIGDSELAKKVSLIKLTLPAEDLRKELLAIVQTRIAELRQGLLHHPMNDQL